jgi:hypothetical protein
MQGERMNTERQGAISSVGVEAIIEHNATYRAPVTPLSLLLKCHNLLEGVRQGVVPVMELWNWLGGLSEEHWTWLWNAQQEQNERCLGYVD